MFVINARKKTTLRILEFLTVSSSVPKERYHALSPPPPVFLLHFKTKLQYYKESMGSDSSLPYSNFAQPAADKAIPLAYNWNGGESPQPSPPVWKNSSFRSSPSPLLQIQALETQVTPVEGERGPFLFYSAPMCSTADNWDLGIWWLYCTSCSGLGVWGLVFCFQRGWNWWLPLTEGGSFCASSSSKGKQWSHVEGSYRSDSCQKGESIILNRLDTKCSRAQLLPIRCWWLIAQG